MEKLIALSFATLIAAFIGSYLASYLKKKGENLATHEDLDKLVEQVRVVTTTTKEIEAKISTDVWDRQKRWEMKRDVLFEATRRLGAVNDSLIGLNAAHAAERQSQSLPSIRAQRIRARVPVGLRGPSVRTDFSPHLRYNSPRLKDLASRSNEYLTSKGFLLTIAPIRWYVFLCYLEETLLMLPAAPPLTLAFSITCSLFSLIL